MALPSLHGDEGSSSTGNNILTVFVAAMNFRFYFFLFIWSIFFKTSISLIYSATSGNLRFLNIQLKYNL